MSALFAVYGKAVAVSLLASSERIIFPFKERGTSPWFSIYTKKVLLLKLHNLWTEPKPLSFASTITLNY